MQNAPPVAPAPTAAAPSLPRHVVRLSGALAAVLGRAGGAELSEDDLLLWLREAGLITYPSPLLARLLQELPEVLAAEVMPRLAPADRASLAGAGSVWRDAAYPRSVFPDGLPRAETPGAARVFKLREFIGCVERLAWAKDNGCPWVARTFALVAMRGQLQVLRWARAHDCPWDADACAHAALGGQLEALKWLQEHGCLWNQRTCEYAAAGGGLEVLKWAREHDCPWDKRTCAAGRSVWAAGDTEVGTGARVSVG